MAEIVGTITNLSDFLSKTQVCLSVKPNDPQQQIICLEADRKYSIPAFQREVRWDDNNLKMLLYDLSRSSKFLGNIILTIKSDHTCEIIDGQQRTTVLMLIVSCIKKKFGTKISTPDLCPLRNEGFTGFQKRPLIRKQLHPMIGTLFLKAMIIINFLVFKNYGTRYLLPSC